MKLKILTAQQDLFGNYDVTVKIYDKEYTYTVTGSDWIMAKKQYDLGNNGKCLNILKDAK
jgi:hypothetical protein